MRRCKTHELDSSPGYEFTDPFEGSAAYAGADVMDALTENGVLNKFYVRYRCLVH